MAEILETTTKHPEQRDNEVFITNADREELRQNRQWYSYPYRVGKVAYSEYGSVLEGKVPVFKKRG